jgi:hypothetical protein
VWEEERLRMVEGKREMKVRGREEDGGEWIV